MLLNKKVKKVNGRILRLSQRHGQFRSRLGRIRTIPPNPAVRVGSLSKVAINKKSVQPLCPDRVIVQRNVEPLPQTTGVRSDRTSKIRLPGSIACAHGKEKTVLWNIGGSVSKRRDLALFFAGPYLLPFLLCSKSANCRIIVKLDPTAASCRGCAHTRVG